MNRAKLARRLAGVALVCALAGAAVWMRGRPPPMFWEAGARQSYTLESRTLIQAQPSRRTGRLTRSAHHLQGTLNLRVFSVGEQILAGVQLSPVEIRRDGTRDLEFEELFSKFFYVTFSPAGEISGFDFPSTIATEDRDTLMDLLRSLQIVIPSTIHRSWDSTEEDAFGTVRARYRYAEALTKSKIDYSEVRDRTGRLNVSTSLEVKRSAMTCEYGAPVSWLSRCAGDELIAITRPGGPPVKLSTTVELERAATAADVPLWSDQLDPERDILQWKAAPVTALSVAQLRQLAALRGIIGEVTLAEYAEELFADCQEFAVTCVSRLNEFLTLHPEAAATIPELLVAIDLNEHQRAMLINALQIDKSSHSQNALLRIVEGDEFPEESRAQAVMALGDVARPADGVLDRLWDIFQHDRSDRVDRKLSDNAMLSLGRIARSLRGSGDNRGETIVTGLRNELSSAHEPGKLSSLMYAAANSGDESFVEPLQQHFFESTTARNRAAAAQALGIYPSEAVDTMYAERLGDESETGVRLAIVKALNGRDTTAAAIGKVCERIEHEENDIVRGEMYRFLMKNRKRPGVRETLERMLAIETSMEHKRIISKALATRK